MSHKAQCNLHLHYAGKHIEWLADSEDDWNGHMLPAVGASSLFHLILAYRFHLGDIVNRYRDTDETFENAARASEWCVARNLIAPELAELSERELRGWLGDMLNYPFMNSPQAGSASRQGRGLAVDVLAADTPTLTLHFLKQCLSELEALVKRQREGMVEY